MDTTFRFISLKWHNTHVNVQQQTTNIDLQTCNYMVAMLEFWPSRPFHIGMPTACLKTSGNIHEKIAN